MPRETIVPVKLIDTAGNFVRTENEQITLQYAYGQTAEKSCELMTDAVSNLLFQLPIQRYCAINLLIFLDILNQKAYPSSVSFHVKGLIIKEAKLILVLR